MYNILSIGKASLFVMACSLCLQRWSACLVVVYCNERALNNFFAGIFVCSQSGDHPHQDVKLV
jgi:hypothetical protein